MYNLTDSDLQRFWAKVALPDANGCMLWTAGKCAEGYGSFWLSGRTVRAHSLSLYLAEGAPPFEGAEAAHACRNRLCVAPLHLSWKTRAENEADKLRDGTVARGERATNAKLTADQVREIYARRGESRRALARAFGVDRRTVRAILTGRNWNSVTGLPRTTPRSAAYEAALAAIEEVAA